MSDPRELLEDGDALLLIEVQVDFCPGGALPVAEGDRIVPVLNRWLEAAAERGIPVYASRDWHPANHVSFRTQGGEWPPHCVQDTPGAAYHPDLRLPADAIKVTKGARFDRDQYSAFDETGLAVQLRRDGIERLWVGGLAQDVCVRASCLGARENGFDATLILAATRPVDPAKGERTLRELREAGVRILE